MFGSIIAEAAVIGALLKLLPLRWLLDLIASQVRSEAIQEAP